MTPNINLIPSAHLAKQQYLLWNPVDETWSEPVDFATAQETAAREPGLQACVLMPDGSTSTPAPFTEIFKRAHPSKPNQPEPTLAKKIKDLLSEPLPGPLDPLPGTTPPKPTAPPPCYTTRTMNPSINTIPTAQLYRLRYLLWQPLEETWSEPVTFTAAMSAYVRDPELQAAIINQDGTTGDPVPFAEIAKRAHTPSKPNLPQPTTPPRAERPQEIADDLSLPPETLTLLTHALRLFLCATYGTFYLTAAGAIIGGFSSGATHIGISGLILGLITAVVHATLSSRAD